MARRFRVQRTIAASPARIWSLLTDVDGYPQWNPSVISLHGRIAAREKIELVSVVNPKRTFSLTVSQVEPARGMVWSDGMPLGLFRGSRTFSLRPLENGDTAFAMEEVYTGALAPMISRSIPDLTESFAQFADGLKAAAEQEPD